jgi:hypothetical protein
MCMCSESRHRDREIFLMKEVRRFVDDRRSIYSLMDEILAVCPRCSRCCVIVPDKLPAGRARGPCILDDRHVVCVHCGFTKDWRPLGAVSLPRRGALCRDIYFHLPLWLQTRCCGHVLWAYNVRHLQVIADYVGANLREQHEDPVHGWRNGSLVNRLPGWIKAGNKRAAVLRSVERLKAKSR